VPDLAHTAWAYGSSVTTAVTYTNSTSTTAYYTQPLVHWQFQWAQPSCAVVGTTCVIPPGTREGWKPPGSEKARKRARKLLLSLLDARQRREFEQHGHFHVHLHTADGVRRYRIRDYKGVERVDERGRVLRRYCIHPPTDFPAEDTAVAQLMLLETDEAEFLRVANEEIVAA
jgi:hypothetical protein